MPLISAKGMPDAPGNLKEPVEAVVAFFDILPLDRPGSAVFILRAAETAT